MASEQAVDRQQDFPRAQERYTTPQPTNHQVITETQDSTVHIRSTKTEYLTDIYGTLKLKATMII